MIPALTLLLLLCASSQAAVHRIDVFHHQHQHRESRVRLAEKHTALEAFLTDTASKEPVTVEGYYHSITGTVALGSPAQTFTLLFDFSSPNLNVVDVNGSYLDHYSLYTIGNITDKQTYNSSASSSYIDLNTTFSNVHLYMNGSVVSDVLQVGDSLQANVTFENTRLVDSDIRSTAYDGTFGLSTVVDVNTNTTLLSQLQSSLDSPVYTLSLDSCIGSVNCTGQITLGGLAPDVCQGDSWTALTTDQPDCILPVFNISSLSTTAMGDTSGCASRVDIPMQVSVMDDFSAMVVSYQIQELFVQASNASYNRSTSRYELTDDQVALAQPVHLHLAGGEVLQLNPDDYATPKPGETGKHYMNILGRYDARAYTEERSITLNMRFLTHYCLSKNFQTGVWSLGSRV